MQYQWQTFNWKQIIDGGNLSFANVNSDGFSQTDKWKCGDWWLERPFRWVKKILMKENNSR